MITKSSLRFFMTRMMKIMGSRAMCRNQQGCEKNPVCHKNDGLKKKILPEEELFKPCEPPTETLLDKKLLEDCDRYLASMRRKSKFWGLVTVYIALPSVVIASIIILTQYFKERKEKRDPVEEWREKFETPETQSESVEKEKVSEEPTANTTDEPEE